MKSKQQLDELAEARLLETDCSPSVAGFGRYTKDMSEKMRKPKEVMILFRDDGSSAVREEMEIAKECGWLVYTSRMEVCRGDLVFGRYSCLPFYKELEADLKVIDARLANTYAQHSYVATVTEWAHHLGDMTPKTWPGLASVPASEPGPFVLKGQTNSRKFQWSTSMFAKDRAAASEVLNRLMDDTLIGQQHIVVRKFVPLNRLMTGLWELPISREFRFFVYRGKILCGGFYWASHYEDILMHYPADMVNPDKVPRDFLEAAIARVKDHVPFFAIDVAQTETGEWIVVELNDGQMSGLSMNDPAKLYKALLVETTASIS
jgi:hypothetical protein